MRVKVIFLRWRINQKLHETSNGSSRVTESEIEYAAKDSHESDNKHQNDIERLNNLLSIKQSDIQFLRTQLNNERDGFQKKLNEMNRNHTIHIEKLQSENNSMVKELQSMERQKEEFARSSQITADSLNKAVKSCSHSLFTVHSKKPFTPHARKRVFFGCIQLSEYATERESLGRLHSNEMERKEKQIREFKETIARQQERIHKLLDTKKQIEIEVSKYKQHLRNMKHDLSRNNGDVLRLTEELKNMSLNENELKSRNMKLEKSLNHLQTKYDNLCNDLNIMTSQRDEMKNTLNKLRFEMNEQEMDKNKFMVKSETAMEMNEALKLELENLRRSSISKTQCNESSEKCHKLSKELSECYKKIEKLSLALDSTKLDLHKLSSSSIPINAYEHLSKNINKLEDENIVLNKRINELEKINDGLQE